MPTLRGNIYYIKRRLPGIGQTERTFATESKRRAEAFERMLLRLCERGHLEPVRAWLDGTVTIHRLADAYEGQKLHEFMAGLRDQTVPLGEGFRQALEAKRPDVKASTHERYRESAEIVKRIAQDVGVDSVAEVCTSEFVQAFKSARLADGSKRQTVNKGLQAISMLATYALGRGWITERPTIKRYESADRIRYLEPDELAAYMAAVRRPFRCQFELLVGTGMRLGDSEILRPADIKFGHGECRALLPDAKTPAGVRAVYIPGWAADSLKRHMEGVRATERIFQIPRRTVQSEHDRTCGLAGLIDYTIHDHRHTAAVSLARAGMPIPTLQKQLGHKSIQQTMKYAAFHPDYHDVGRFFDAVEQRFGLSSQGTVEGTPRPKRETERTT